MKMNVYSFDVFDTLLTRKVGEPKSVFLLLGHTKEKLGNFPFSAESFCNARIEAEKRARKNLPTGEPSIQQIYDELAFFLGLTKPQKDLLLFEELAIEEKLICPVPNAYISLDKARQSTEKILFVSDMYLPWKFIYNQLLKFGFWKDGDNLYVSHEIGKSKSTGNLFLEICDREGLTPSELLHFGNNEQSDFQVPRFYGIQSHFLPEANLNRYEKILEEFSFSTQGLSSAIAGASRLARLSSSTNSAHQSALRDVASGVVAPTLIAYVLWTLQRATQLQLKRLYFVSRDGQILHQIALKLVEKLGLDCEVRYLYGSRNAWHLPSLINKISPRELSWILDEDVNGLPSIRRMLKRLSLKPEDIKIHLDALGLTQSDWDRNISITEKTLLVKILQYPEIQSYIFQKADAKRSILVAYLKQEGLIGQEGTGIVDIGWLGRAFESVCTVIEESGGQPPRGFFFGLLNSSAAQTAKAEAYFFDKRFDLGFSYDVFRGICPHLEVFCSATHGQVFGYEMRDLEVIPLLKEELNFKLLNWGLEVVHNVVDSVAENLLLEQQLVNSYLDLREPVFKLLKAFWQSPTSVEALAWGSFPYEEDQTGDCILPLAQPFSLSEIRRIWQTTQIQEHYKTSWYEGSISITPPKTLLILKLVARLSTLNSRIQYKFSRIFRKVKTIIKTNYIFFPKREASS